MSLILAPAPKQIEFLPAPPLAWDMGAVRVEPPETRLEAAAHSLLADTVRHGDPAKILRLEVRPDSGLPAEGYRLELSAGGVHIVSADAAGAFRGLMTLRQIARQAAPGLPALRIIDAPDFAVRGVMLDISRDKAPTLATLLALIDRLAEMKYNHLELYTEHTFAYRNHEAVWRDASPLTAEDIHALDAYCQNRFVELAPNQNSFGHMGRFLQHPAYRDLAECPDGFTSPWNGKHCGPGTLNPLDPRSLALVRELHAELLPHFTSRQFNVGCDETFELGQGRSQAECGRVGKERVYLDFLLKVNESVRSQGARMMFWGDMLIDHPEYFPEIPADAILLNWGYEAKHDFGAQCRALAAGGRAFYVCPGTSSWMSIAGRTDNALQNILNAADAGLRHGAQGYLLTDWGDAGHWQYLPISELPFLAGAMACWNRAGWSEELLLAAADRHVFQDAAGGLARVAFDLGNAYRRTGIEPHNCTVLFQWLHQLEPDFYLGSPDAATLAAIGEYVGTCAERIGRARPGRADGELVRAEFANAARMLRHACRYGEIAQAGRRAEPAARAELAADLQGWLPEHARLWRARNRPGGWRDSVRPLELRLASYRQ